jgi:hypothetical protein
MLAVSKDGYLCHAVFQGASTQEIFESGIRDKEFGSKHCKAV